MTRDADIRRAAFAWLVEQRELHDDVLPYSVLQKGLEFDGERVPLVGPQGIFKPRVMQLPLSITTAMDGPYDDSLGPDGLLRYRYRGTDPGHRDNVGLRELFRRKIPLIYLHALVRGSYLALWPVFVVGDAPDQLTFTVAVDDQLSLDRLIGAGVDLVASDNTETEIRRGYVTAVARRRIHQRAFRERVIDAYRRQCALCRLRHKELLDAAHIVPDSDPDGEPRVSNGIALCKLHHAAFDKYFISVRPDFVIEVRRDVLTEEDGPMLKHGLQGMHDQQIQVPKQAKHRPDQEFLERRHRRFLELTPR
jgi:putative restriction endonuclease